MKCPTWLGTNRVGGGEREAPGQKRKTPPHYTVNVHISCLSTLHRIGTGSALRQYRPLQRPYEGREPPPALPGAEPTRASTDGSPEGRSRHVQLPGAVGQSVRRSSRRRGRSSGTDSADDSFISDVILPLVVGSRGTSRGKVRQTGGRGDVDFRRVEDRAVGRCGSRPAAIMPGAVLPGGQGGWHSDKTNDDRSASVADTIMASRRTNGAR